MSSLVVKLGNIERTTAVGLEFSVDRF